MNPLIKRYGKEERFVVWKLQERNGKKTKIPYSIAGDLASSTDPSTWSIYDEAKNFSDNVGIVFTPDQTLLGIDIDHCLNKDTKKIQHEEKEAIENLIKEANTYTEISPSGEGLHIYLEIDGGKLDLIANRHGSFEAYTSGRYFTITLNAFEESKSIRKISHDEANKLLSIIGYPWKKKEETVHKNSQELFQGIELNDSEILQKMFASKNGAKIKAIYDLNNGKSEDDLSLCSYLAFWTRKDPLQMERIWMTSPLGSRKKTQQREDYRKRTITTAIASCRDVYEPSPALKTNKIVEKFDLDLLFTLDSKRDKIFTQNTENICRILRKHPDFKNNFRYDIFKNALEIYSKNKWRKFEDNDEVDIQTQISILFSFFGRVGKQMVRDAMVKVAIENSIDSALDYITALKWDKILRLNEWLYHTYGCPIDTYHISVGSNWLKGLVKRIVEPGCKFDYVLVLEGEQGSKKSTSLSILARGLHVESTTSTDNKDFFMQFSGNLIIEFSEGDTMNRTEVKKMKAIITTQVDKYRPAYGHTVQEFPRRCVFAMTTNDEQYLKDETGNRRWLPVKLELLEANVEWLQENREQLFAEAYHRIVNLKETIYDFPKQETLMQQDNRRVRDPNTDLVQDWYYNKLTNIEREQGITINQVYKEVLHGGFTPSRPIDKKTEMIIGDILRTTGLEKKRVMKDKVQLNRYFEKIIALEIDNGKKITIKDEDDY